MPSATALATTHATLISAFITGSYVGGLYILRSARLSFAKTPQDVDAGGERLRQANERWRDDEDVIKGRLKAALISTCISCGVVYLCVAQGYNGDWTAAITPTLRLLGLTFPAFDYKSIIPHLAIPLLYTGPLTAHFLSGSLPLQHNWSYRDNILPYFNTYMGMRNYIFAPITEELVFRSCLLAVAEMSGRGPYHKILVTPLWFGIAHIHHAYELFNRFGRTRTALTRAAIICLFQLSYTTLFGAYAAFLLYRTHSVFPPISAHFTANVLGLPNPGREFTQHPNHKMLISVAYLVGIFGFGYLLGSGSI